MDYRANETASAIIRTLDLARHPEGGWYRETFRDRNGSGNRAASTAIYFLLMKGEKSRWHRIDAAEVWHFYAGAPVELHVAAAGSEPVQIVLGADIIGGEEPQVVIPPDSWQCAESLGDWTLVGCTVALGFEFDKFELAPDGWRPPARKD